MPLEPELIKWAEVVLVIESAHRNKLLKKFKQHVNGQRIVVLGIPDEYEFMEPSLVRVVEAKVSPYLARYAPRA